MFNKGFKIWGKEEKWFLVAVLVLLGLLIAYYDNQKALTGNVPDSVYCAAFGCK